MVEKQQIIIGHFRQGKSGRALSRELNISRNTVMKYINEYKREVENTGKTVSEHLRGQGVIKAPMYKNTQRKRRSLTERVCRYIDEQLLENERKRSQGRHKQQMAATDIYEALIEQGYKIGYTTVCRYIRQQKHKSAEVYIKQVYTPGQSVEFDWAEVKLIIDNKLMRLMLAVFTSSFSNYRWARLYYRQDMSSFLHCHSCYFDYTQSVPGQMLYDNMRVAIKKFTIRNSDKIPTDDLLKLSTYYQFEYRFCNARRGNEKGHVERSVEFIRRKAFARKDSFDSLAQANEHLLQTCERLNKRTAKGQSETIEQLFKTELQYMKVAPPPYDAAEFRNLRVDKYSCIKVDTNYYSVPEGYVGAFINVKVYPDSILIYDKNNLIASHERRISRFKYYLKLEHYLNTLLIKPGALTGALTFHQAQQILKDIYYSYFKSQNKEFIELLLFIKNNNFSIVKLQNVINKCLAKCPASALNLDKLKFLLSTNSTDIFIGDNDNPNKSNDPMTNEIKHNALKQLSDIQSLIN